MFAPWEHSSAHRKCLEVPEPLWRGRKPVVIKSERKSKVVEQRGRYKISRFSVIVVPLAKASPVADSCRLKGCCSQLSTQFPGIDSCFGTCENNLMFHVCN